MTQERNHEYEDLFRDHRTHAIASRARPLQTNLREHDDGSLARSHEPDFVIEFRDLDYAFDVFSGAISLKEALAARLFATHGANSKGVAITYLFDTVLRTFFCWRSAYRR